MNRRNLLMFLALGALFTRAHAQPKTMKGIEAMQDNWKTLLAPGTEGRGLLPRVLYAR